MQNVQARLVFPPAGPEPFRADFAPPGPPSTRSLKVPLHADVPLARRARLAFRGRLAEARQVELVQVVLLVRDVLHPDRRRPGASRVGPLEPSVGELVAR